MAFKEFQNPLEQDYDITSSLRSNDNEKSSTNKIDYALLLSDAMECIIEDIDTITDEELLEEFGITKKEYLHPSKEVVLKVRKTMQAKQKRHSSR